VDAAGEFPQLVQGAGGGGDGVVELDAEVAELGRHRGLRRA
jgi:hypothetical protein